MRTHDSVKGILGGLVLLWVLMSPAPGQGDVAYSPDGTFLYVYAPCGWDGVGSPASEYEAVGSRIKDQDYNVTAVIYRDQTANDDDCGSCTLEHFKDCEFADFLYVTTHSNSGMMVGIYLKSKDAVDRWRDYEADTQTRESSVVIWDGSPAYYARVPASWYSSRWRDRLDESKAVVVLSGCETAPGLTSAVVSGEGGGVCFGYTGYPALTDRHYNNTRLLKRMSGQSGGAQLRRAGEAWDGGNGYLSGFEMVGDPDRTLCPAYEGKFPEGRARASGTGHFEVDTYCHDHVPASEALTFETAGPVLISNVRWVGTDVVRRIEFDWSGLGAWSVVATAHADKFQSWGAATASYHRMDGNGVTPNGDDVVWTFYRHVCQGVRTPKFIGFTSTTPNPFNPNAEIAYELAEGCHVKLEIYDALGRRVATLVDEHQQPGRWAVRWDARGGEEVELPSGVYFCRLEAGRYLSTAKIVLVK